MIELMQGDCLVRMKEIPDGSIDMVLTDPPYGTTACKWDSIILLEPMWEQLKRIIKPNGAIVMTASQPFTTTLISSNMKMFRYCWVWDKAKATNFMSAKCMPLLKTEDVCVFSYATSNSMSKLKMNYYPQGIKAVDWDKTNGNNVGGKVAKARCAVFKGDYKQKVTGYPKNIIDIPNDNNKLHPTQKPVALMEYLIRTYTNENETVLDFTMGSGSTGVACVNTNRNFIGIELDETYFNIAKNRIN
jgi:site-specific DNA-methyltransferase (adenine-specific)